MKLLKCLVSVALLTALAGCSSTDVIDDVKKSESSRIGFDTHMNKESRALANNSFTDFFVYGTYTVGTSSQPVQVFMGDRVTKTNGSWTYANDRYWNPQGSYDFYAYSCENLPLATNISGHPGINGRYLNLLDFMVTPDHCKHDLVYAYALQQTRPAHGTTSSPTQPVSLSFKHILTRLKFTFKSEIPGNSYTVKISNVKVVNYYNSANFLGSTREWASHVRVAPVDEAPELALSFSNGNIIQQPEGGKAKRIEISTDAVYMIPYAYKDANVKLEFDFDMQSPDNNGQLKDVMGSHITATWKPSWGKGYSVNNVITLTGSATGMDPIRFTASIDPEEGAAADGWIVSGSTGNFVFDQTFNSAN